MLLELSLVYWTFDYGRRERERELAVGFRLAVRMSRCGSAAYGGTANPIRALAEAADIQPYCLRDTSPQEL